MLAKKLQRLSRGGEVEEGFEPEGGFIIARSDTALLFELAEYALDAIAVTVAAIVWMVWRFTDRAGRDYRQDAAD